MADQNKIENISTLIASKVESLQIELVRDLMKLSKDKRFQSAEDFLFALERLNIEELVLVKAKNITNLYESAHTQVLADTKMFGEISERMLRGVTNFSTSTFTDSLGNLGKILRKEIITGAISGASDKAVLDGIQAQAGLSNKQMKTLITTGLNDYSRSVSKVMMESLPIVQKYRYVGAIDNKTRPICLKMWESGTLTQQQIKSKFGAEKLVEGGGFNCRHQWLPVEAEDPSKDFRNV